MKEIYKGMELNYYLVQVIWPNGIETVYRFADSTIALERLEELKAKGVHVFVSKNHETVIEYHKPEDLKK